MEDLLAFERNKYERLLREQGAGIAEEIADTIELELIAIEDIAQHINPDDTARITRRVKRIREFLREYGNQI